MKKLSTLIITACLTVNLAFPATWYVATTGNDADPGTLSQPFLTLSNAVLEAAPGDTIMMRNGNYTSNEIRINKSNLVIKSYPGEWAVITAPVNIEDVASCIWYDNPDVSGGVLERLEIIGGYYYGVSFETNWEWGLPLNERHGASNIYIVNCKIHDTGRDAIKIKPGCNNLQILGCELYQTGIGPSNSVPNGGPNAEGIDNVNGDGMVVRSCYIHNTSTSGVYAKGGAGNCTIEENLIMNTGEAGILLGFYTDAEFFDNDGTNPNYYECQNSIARNNIVVNTGGAGIGIFAALHCMAYNNTVITASPMFHAPLFLSRGEVYIDENTTLNPMNTNIEVFNNIFIDESGTGDEDYTVEMRENSMSGTNIINYNIFYKTTGAAIFSDGVSFPALNFAQWKTSTGYDAQSMETDANPNSQYHLNAGSPAVDAGTSSPAFNDYDAQLRSGATDIGADEYNNGPALAVPPPPNVVGTGTVITNISVEEQGNELYVRMYPNPAQAWIMVETEALDDLPLLTLTNITGQQIANIKALTINVETIPAGMYMLTIRAGKKQKTIPVIIHH